MTPATQANVKLRDAVHLSKVRCLLSQAHLTLSSGIDVRMATAVGVTLPEEGKVTRRAFVLVPTEVSDMGVELDDGLRWRRCAALDLGHSGFDSLDLSKLVARRLAYVADDAAELVFAVRKAA